MTETNRYPDPFAHYLPQVKTYLDDEPALPRALACPGGWSVSPLAKGEYNCNYLIRCGASRLVFRVNIGTQIGRDDQILYEYNALKLLEKSGVTPVGIHVDDSRSRLDRGILVMSYLPGRPLDYTNEEDLAGAAAVFAKIHQLAIAPEANHLIREDRPLSLIFAECSRLLESYFASPLADPEIAAFLRRVLEWAEGARARESFFADNPWFAIVNTETNANNFIVDDDRLSVHLVDWEMPRFGDPSTDLCHFCSPLTTLWKTTFRFSPEGKKRFLDAYRQRLESAELAASLEQRMALKDPFVYLRGISWSAYAWAAYQGDFAGVRNEDTWRTLCSYLQLPFIESLFLPFMAA